MSVFSEFHKAWRARFPVNDLPAAWEEDVRANLAKHRSRVVVLKEELEKEQFYVEYLECLLKDVQRQQMQEGDCEEFEREVVQEEERGQGEGSEGAAPICSGGVDSAVTQAINTMMVQRRHHPNRDLSSPVEELESEEPKAMDSQPPLKVEGARSAPPSDEEEGPLAPITPLAAPPPAGGSTVRDLARRFTSSGGNSSVVGRPPPYNRSTSVPGITSALPCGGPQGKESQFVTVISVNGAGQGEDARGRKVPPAPPPKTFRKSTGAEGEGEAKVPTTPSSPGASRPPHAIPRSPQRPRHPSPIRDSQGTAPTKMPLQKTLSASSDSRPATRELHKSPQGGRDLQKSPTHPKELQKSPSSASSTGSLGKKCISKSSSSASSCGGSGGAPSRRIGLSKTSSLSSSRCGEDDDEVGGGSASGASLENLTDDEPLYDTVAPDEDDDTGEYVLLSDKSSEYNGTDTLKSAASGASSEGGLSKSGGGASSGATPSGGSPAPEHPPDSPKYSNYVNIDFFLKKKKARGRHVQRSESVESDDEEAPSLFRSLSSDHEDEPRDEPLDIDSGQLRPDPRPELRPDPRPELRPDPSPELRPDPRPELRPDPRPKLRPDPRPKLRPDPRPELRPDPRPELRPDPRPELRPDPRPELRPDPRPEPGVT
ncbi:nascent polypeptide-associated complex subunit alpha, muscle-specific form-like [Homarus americanus]|uniref:nascent polypeptide-associated complex subunit alpha, muscle-specific form-like n=1 Tax=Homarus americanus TaxID=6706 RepID=UPI001C45C2C8|nr:nascent polypeptide-associated complex subunit alpha, muscle-specific form-like [Homarus americanus]